VPARSEARGGLSLYVEAATNRLLHSGLGERQATPLLMERRKTSFVRIEHPEPRGHLTAEMLVTPNGGPAPCKGV
jgi:hypothetical protein